MKSNYLICTIVVLVFSTFNLVQAELNSKTNPKLAKVLKNFPKSDTSGDGVLTISELRGFVSKKIKNGATSSSNLYLKRLLKEEKDADKNNDGVLTKDELLAHLK